jgi:hypothetical protein
MSVGLPTIFSVPDWQRLRAATLAILFVGCKAASEYFAKPISPGDVV